MGTITTAEQYIEACGIIIEQNGDGDLLSEFNKFERRDEDDNGVFTDSSNEELDDNNDDEDLPPLYMIDGSDLDAGEEDEELMFSAY